MTTATRNRPGRLRRVAVCLGKVDPDCNAKVHGTANAYAAYRCRCATAREAWRIYNKRRREGRNQPDCIDGTGTIRRIQGLVAIGWSWRALARESTYSIRTVQSLGYAERTRVTRHTAGWVEALYERLSGTPGNCRYALIVARRRGFHPPLAWEGTDIDDPAAQPITDAPTLRPAEGGYDPIVVGFAVEGRLTYDQIKDNRPDLIETVRRLARTLGDHEIARHLRWPGADSGDVGGRNRGQNTVCSFRKRNNIPGPEKYEAVYAYGTRSRARTDKAA